jgi:uncharacterized membrane protein HdeD (DUF308 family)
MIKNYVKKYEKYSILISILMLVFALLLMIKPIKSLEIVIISFSIILMISGISSFIHYLTLESEIKVFSLDLIFGILTIISSILIFVYRIDLIGSIPTILGIWIIISNLIHLQLSLNLSGLKNSGWLTLLFTSIINIILGIILIVKPFGSLITLTFLAGLILFITEILNIIDSLYILSSIKKLEKIFSIN